MVEKPTDVSSFSETDYSSAIKDFKPEELIKVFPDWTWEEKVFVQIFEGGKKRPVKEEKGWVFRTDFGLIQITKEPGKAFLMIKKGEFLVKDLEKISILANRSFKSVSFEGSKRQLTLQKSLLGAYQINIYNLDEEGQIEYHDHIKFD
jgi:hypothetical protein